MEPIRYRCPQCDNPATYEIDLNLPDKDMPCQRCGHQIMAGEMCGGGEFRRIEASDSATMTEEASSIESRVADRG